MVRNWFFSNRYNATDRVSFLIKTQLRQKTLLLALWKNLDAQGHYKIVFPSEPWALLIQGQWLQLHLHQQQRPLLAASRCHSNQPNPPLPFRLLCRQHWRPSNCPHPPLPPRQRKRSRKSGEIWKLTHSNLIILLSQVISVFLWQLLWFGSDEEEEKPKKEVVPLVFKNKREAMEAFKSLLKEKVGK